MYSTEEPKTKKARTFTMASASTYAPEMTERTTTKLDSLPSEMLLHIAEFTGANSCFLGYGVVNKRINQLFNMYSNKLSKKTSYGGYAPFQDIVEKCVKKMEDKEKVYEYWFIPEIFHQLASGVVTFNRMELLHWTLEIQNKNIFQAICVRAIKDGKLVIIERVWNSIRDEALMAYMKEQWLFAHFAAQKGDLTSLKYLNEHGYEWNEWACSSAAGGGHLDCLVYLHEQGCEWDDEAYDEAAGEGHLDCLVYLHKQGCPWNGRACTLAAFGGHLDCLMYLHEHGCEWDEEACSAAALNGHLDCLVYLHEQGCPWNNEACDEAARKGHLKCLVYLHKQGCEWDEYTCHNACKGGSVDCLKYLHNEGCPWDYFDCYTAAIEAHLERVDYLSREFALDSDDCLKRFKNDGHFECMEYMRQVLLKRGRK